MTIYLKKLTKDLLWICRSLDGNPELKRHLAEIIFDVSLLPDVVYGIDKEIEIPASRLELLASLYD